MSQTRNERRAFAFASFQAAEGAFRRTETALRQEIVRQKLADMDWRVDALVTEADRLKSSAEQTNTAVERKLGRQARSATNIPTPVSAEYPVTLEGLGQALNDMRKQLYALRQLRDELTDDYREPVRRVPAGRILLAWLVLAIIVFIVATQVVLPLIGFGQRVYAYFVADQAVLEQDWDRAIERFTFAYTTGPFRDSQARLIETYDAAIQADFSAGEWDAARDRIVVLDELDIANDRADDLLQESYVIPAQSAYADSSYDSVRNQLDNLPPPLDPEAELLYKQSYLEQALAASEAGDWAVVEELTQRLRNRPTGETEESLQIEQQGRNLLSRSYTERAQALIEREQWEAARDILQPALRPLLADVDNYATAQDLLRETYYAAGQALATDGDYEAARAQFEILLGLGDDTPYQDTQTEYYRTFYEPAAAALDADQYEDARADFLDLFAVVRDVDAPYLNSQELYLDTFYEPAAAALEADNYETARAQFEAMFDTDPASRTHRGADELYLNTFYEPAEALLEANEYEAARDQFEAMFAVDPTSREYLESQQLYRDTFYEPANNNFFGADGGAPNYPETRRLLEDLFATDEASADEAIYRDLYRDAFYQEAEDEFLDDPDAGIIADYPAVRQLLDEMFAIDPAYRAYEDSTALYRDSFYNQALDLINGDPAAEIEVDYETARVLLEQMFAVDFAYRTYRDSLELYYRTFYDPAVNAMADEQYDSARDLFVDMFSTEENSRRYEDSQERYRDTFYIPAAAALTGDPDANIPPNYIAARTIFEQMFVADEFSRTHRDSNELYLDTHYLPAVNNLDAGNYAAARTGFERMFVIDPASRQHRNATNSYRDSFLLDANDLILATEYVSARTLLLEMFSKDPASRNYSNAEDRFYDTFYLPAAELLGADDYGAARAAFLELFAVVETADAPYLDSQALYYDTFYLPAAELLGAGDYGAARAAFLELFDVVEADDAPYLDSQALYYDTFYLPASELLEADDYGAARAAFLELFDVVETDDAPYLDSQALYYDTFYLPANELLEAGDYGAARAAFLELFDVVEADDAPYLDSQALYYDTFYLPANELLGAGDYDAARAAFLDLFAVVEADEAPPYLDSQALYYDTFYLPANELLGAGDYDAARAGFVALFNVVETADAPYRDSYDRYYDTFLTPALAALSGDDETAPDYARARLLLSDMFEAEIENTPGRAYRGDQDLTSQELYYETYLRPALALLPGYPNYSANARYAAARAILLDLFTDPNGGAASRLYARDNITSLQALYHDTFIVPARHAQETENYVRARILLNALFDADPSTLTTEDGDVSDTRRLYFEMHLQPADAVLDEFRETRNPEAYLAARGLLLDLFDDPYGGADAQDYRDGLAVDQYYDTFVLPAEAALTGDTRAGVAPDYETARALLANLFESEVVGSPTNTHTGDLDVPSQDLYYETYLRPALERMPDYPGHSANARYAAARQILLDLFADPYGDAASRLYARDNITSLQALYYDTFLIPAREALEGEDYIRARVFLKAMFDADPDSLNQPFPMDAGAVTEDTPTSQERYFEATLALADERLARFSDTEDQADYEYARRRLLELFASDYGDEASRDYRDSILVERYYDTYVIPATVAIANGDYETGRSLLTGLFAADEDGLDYPATENLTSRELYFETVVALAGDLLNTTLTTSADPDSEEPLRPALDPLFSVERDDVDTPEITSQERYLVTLVGAARTLLGSDRRTAEDYDAARALLDDLFASEFGGELSSAYPSVRKFYLDTYYVQAQGLVSAVFVTDDDYLTAGALLADLFAYDDDAENHADGDALWLYYRTFHDPALAVLLGNRTAEPNYEGARELFAEMFAVDDRSRDYAPPGADSMTAEERYWDSIYIPALKLHNTADYLGARTALGEIVRDGGGARHRRAEFYFLNTYYMRGQNFTYGNSELGIAVDYDQAQSEYSFILNYEPVVEDEDFRGVTFEFNQTHYLPGAQLLADGDYEAARAEFTALLARDAGDHRDTLMLYQDSFLRAGRDLIDAGLYEQARDPLNGLLTDDNLTPIYRRLARRELVTSYWEPADQLLEAEAFEDARVLLDELYALLDGPYALNAGVIDVVKDDTAQRLIQAYTPIIIDQIENNDFEAAQANIQYILEIDEGALQEALLLNFYYQQAVTALDNDRFSDARSLLNILQQNNSNYRNTTTLLYETYYEPAVILLGLGNQQQDPERCQQARLLLDVLIDEVLVEGGDSDYRDARNLRNRTYVCEVDIALARNDLPLARALILELSAVSPFYADIEEQFIQSYYDPANEAFLQGNYPLARDILDDLVTGTPVFFYEQAFILLRDTYYTPGEAALSEGNWEAARREFAALMEIDSNYREVRALYRDTYFIPASNFAGEGDWGQARSIVQALLRNPTLRQIYRTDDPAQRLLYNTYMEPARSALAESDWQLARDQLHTLLRDPLLDARYLADGEAQQQLYRSYLEPASIAAANGDWQAVLTTLDVMESDTLLMVTYAQSADWLPTRMDAHYQLATAAFSTALTSNDEDDWGAARDLLGGMSDDINRLRGIAENESSLLAALDALPTGSLSDPASDYLDRAQLYNDTYFIPGVRALDAENWQVADEQLRALVVNEALPDHTNPTYADLTAGELYAEAFLRPGAAAFAVEDWDTARRSYRVVVTSLTDYANPEQAQTARATLLQAYITPAENALTQRDWATARVHYSELLSNEADILADDERARYEAAIEDTYTQPIDIALENRAYDAMRRAISQYRRAYPLNVDYAAARWRESYETPLQEALTENDLFSAAEQYVALKAVIAPDDAGLQETFTAPENAPLRQALADRFEPFWQGVSYAGRPPVRYLPINGTPAVADIAFDPNGTRFATTHANGFLHIWHTNDGSAAPGQEVDSVLTVITTAAWLNQVEWQPVAGDWLATSGDDNRVLVWSSTTGQLLADLNQHAAPISALTVSEDGTRLAAGGEDGRVLIWDAADWSIEPQAFTFETEVSTLLLSNSESLLAVGLADGQVVLIDPATGAEQTRLQTGIYVTQIMPLPNRDELLVFGHDAQIQRWSRAGAQIGVLGGHTDWLRGGSLLGNGRLLATLDASGSLLTWDTGGTGEPTLLTTLTFNAPLPSSLAFAPDGSGLLIADRTTGVSMWFANVETYLTQGESDDAS